MINGQWCDACFLFRGKPLDFFTQEGPVFGIDSDPLNSNVFSMAGDEGHLMIYDVRDSSGESIGLRDEKWNIWIEQLEE